MMNTYYLFSWRAEGSNKAAPAGRLEAVGLHPTPLDEGEEGKGAILDSPLMQETPILGTL